MIILSWVVEINIVYFKQIKGNYSYNWMGIFCLELHIVSLVVINNILESNIWGDHIH